MQAIGRVRLYLLRILRLDDSDNSIYRTAATAGELAVPGTFMTTFSDRDPESLEGPDRAAFRNGFLGVDTLGWGTLVTVGEATADERRHVVERLIRVFLERFGAPDTAAAREQAEEELAFVERLCQRPVNTILSVERSLADGAVREQYRTHRQEAGWEGAHPVFTFAPEPDGDSSTGSGPGEASP